MATPWPSMNGPSRWQGQEPVSRAAPKPKPVDPNPDFFDGPGRVEGSYNSDNAGSDGHAPGWAIDTIRNRYTDALARTGGVAQRGEEAYLDRATKFDAGGYARDASQAAFNQFLPELKRNIGELRGQQVGMGRLDTGFATEDEDRLVTESTGRLTDQIAGYGMQAAGLQLDNDQGLGRFGAEYGNRYLDLVSGQYDRKTAEENDRKASKGSGLGGFIKGAAQVGSMFL